MVPAVGGVWRQSVWQELPFKFERHRRMVELAWATDPKSGLWRVDAIVPADLLADVTV